MDQFVATFHRFCGDDQTFFVATMTSRPIGLETAFSIQLADKQPVLRGLCIVLDAWETPENRYKRPGIRLGIKRLTADSQIVFDRLKAASKAPAAIAEATPTPGPLPVPPVPGILPGLRPPAFPLRAIGSSPAVTPQVPPLNALRTALPPVRARTATSMPPPVSAMPVPPAMPASPAKAAPPAVEPTPPAVEARSPVLPSVVKLAPAPPPVIPIEAKLEPIAPEPRAAPEPSPSPEPAPVAVTRFQVALKVGTIPPPLGDVEFKPNQLLSRLRSEPRVVSDPPPEEPPVEPGLINRPSELEPRPAHDTMPNTAVADFAAPAPEPAPAADLRTPGSAYVLPANPLHNLSDESLEGFVDCTLYEETANIFHPATDGGEWNDDVADPPVTQPARVTPPHTSVPAMPFDTPPNLTVRSLGRTESLAVAPDEPPPEAEPQEAPSFEFTSSIALFAPLHDVRAESAAPWIDAASASYGNSFAPQASYPESEGMPGDPLTAMPVRGDTEPGQRLPAYSTVDATRYSHHNALPLAALPEPEPIRVASAWQRWLLISGTAAVAVVIAFVVARLARGSDHAEPVVVATGAAAVSPRATPAPGLPPGAKAGPGSAARQPAVHDHPPPAAAEPARSADPAAESLSPDDDGEAVSGGTPIAGSGPCRFTVATTPAGSLVRLDDQAMGPSPITIDGTCDRHKVEVSHARYQSQTKWVTLAADKPQELDINLPRPVHAVTVTSFPLGAELSIDGHRAGTTPTVVQMVGFATVNLTFTKAGFQSVTKKVYSKLPQDRVFVKLIR